MQVVGLGVLLTEPQVLALVLGEARFMGCTPQVLTTGSL